jgi:hypothetical protein
MMIHCQWTENTRRPTNRSGWFLRRGGLWLVLTLVVLAGLAAPETGLGEALIFP